MEKFKANPVFVATASAIAVSLIWVVLAWRTPTSTFHFAPIIAGAVGPYAAKSTAGSLPRGRGLQVAAASLAAVTSAIVLLAVADRLQGPTFWSEDGAWIEAAIFALIGAVIGLGYLLAGGEQPAAAHPPTD